MLWLTPAMDRLFADAASGRRRFLDRLVLALRPDHATHTARYEAAMRARNKLLAEDGPWDEAWLAALEARMAEHGAAISRSPRRHRRRARRSGSRPRPKARSPAPGWRSRAASRAISPRPAPRDAAAGRTLAGPHRADLVVTHVGKNQPAALCSTGEQKALLIGLILAHADLVAERTGRRPILLLDEIAAHLDPAAPRRLVRAAGRGRRPGLDDRDGAGPVRRDRRRDPLRARRATAEPRLSMRLRSRSPRPAQCGAIRNHQGE